MARTDLQTDSRHDLFQAADLLASEFRHLDPDVQMAHLGIACNLLTCIEDVRLLFGFITILPDLPCLIGAACEGDLAGGPGFEENIFADENRQLSANRWFIVSRTGEVQFAGEVNLRATPPLTSRRRAVPASTTRPDGGGDRSPVCDQNPKMKGLTMLGRIVQSLDTLVRGVIYIAAPWCAGRPWLFWLPLRSVLPVIASGSSSGQTSFGFSWGE